ncbi:MAG: 16S rRNA (cytidine(1402)-2'-O)-methyltransferase [Actinomycetota bacterium]
MSGVAGNPEAGEACLVIVGTPLGNLGDFSPRAQQALARADLIACEDTRVTRRLLSHFGLHIRQVSFHEGNEMARLPQLVSKMEAGSRVALVADAGMPGISDPGYRLVRACVDRGIPVEVVPGPSAAIAALVVSGLPSARFAFEGFLPRRAGQRRKRLTELAADERTLVFYESPHRLADCLTDMLEVMGDRQVAMARELTKLHEEVLRGRVSEVLEQVGAREILGECTLVVEGAPPAEIPATGPGDAAAAVGRLEAQGMDRKSAMAAVARELGLPKRQVYSAVVDMAKREGKPGRDRGRGGPE